MKKMKIWNDAPSDKQLDQICALVEDGAVIVMPTDTLYALVCDALNPKAIDRLCRLKGLNPEKNNLSVICPGISMAAEYARIDNAAFKLLRDNTPGPFTFLFKASSSLPRVFKGRKTVGVRIPASRLARSVAERLGRPLLTTSINFDDPDHAVSPGLIEEAYDGRADFFVEGDEGNTRPSTVVDCTGGEAVVVRQGCGLLE